MFLILFVTMEIRSVLLVVVILVLSAWGKFWVVLPTLTSRTVLYMCSTRVQIYNTYICPDLLYASECLAPNANGLLKLERNYCAVVRWICNVCLKDRISLNSWYQQHRNLILISLIALVWLCCKE